MSSTSRREKHWEFSIYGADLTPIISPVVERAYAWCGDGRNAERVEVLAAAIISDVGYGVIDFDHDPGESEDPVITIADLLDRLDYVASGRRDADNRRFSWSNDPLVGPLFDDGFAPLDAVSSLVEGVATAVAAAIADETISVTAEEPYDSCRNCGGYHNVNYDCDRSEDD